MIFAPYSFFSTSDTDLNIEKIFISTFKASIFVSGVQTSARVVKLLIKYVTCFNFSKSISQSITADAFGRKKDRKQACILLGGSTCQHFKWEVAWPKFLQIAGECKRSQPALG